VEITVSFTNDRIASPPTLEKATFEMRILNQGLVFDAGSAPPHRRFCSFTSTLVLPSGRILVTFRSGSSKDAPDENILICSSDDQGMSWKIVFEGFDPMIDGIPGGWRVGALTEISPGRLVGFFNWFDRSDRIRPLANPATQGTLPSRLFVMDSFDNGHTWASRREVDTRPFQGIAMADAILKLADGTLGLPYEAWKSYEDPGPGQHHALLRLSQDGAHTFGPAVTVAHDPLNNTFFWDQRLAVDCSKGDVIALFWTHDRKAEQDLAIHIAWGSSDGKTWTGPLDTGIAGQIASPLIMPGGEVLMVYVHRHDPPSLRAVLSRDFGRSWDRAGELILYQSGAGPESGMDGRQKFSDYWVAMNRWQFGHPDASPLADGDVFVAFYAGNAGALSIQWVRLTEVVPL